MIDRYARSSFSMRPVALKRFKKRVNAIENNYLSRCIISRAYFLYAAPTIDIIKYTPICRTNHKLSQTIDVVVVFGFNYFNCFHTHTAIRDRRFQSNKHVGYIWRSQGDISHHCLAVACLKSAVHLKLQPEKQTNS